ncbi:MAG: phospholipase D-like domain-containing protein [Opitutales bacterium]
MKTILLILIGAFLALALLPYFVARKEDMPPGTDLKSPDFSVSHAELLIDRTSRHPDTGESVKKHEIFEAALKEIKDAETFILADFFLWNPWKGEISPDASMRNLSDELAEALMAKRAASPDLPILVITDPINRIYGDHEPGFFKKLEEAGIPVVFTDLSQLPDSNRLYAPHYQFWGHFIGAGNKFADWRICPNPFKEEGEKLSFRQLARLLLFKANHRKVLITGRKDGRERVLIGSFNPADGSANHGNLAALVEGPVARYAARSELAVAKWSLPDEKEDAAASQASRRAMRLIEARLDEFASPDEKGGANVPGEGEARAAWRSEGAVRETLIDLFEAADSSTRVDVALFYLSDRKVIAAMKDAIRRGARFRILLDANKDAFGREKSGIPNRPVADELMQLADEHSVEIRWAATAGEQFHPKALRLAGAGRDILFLGSSNWTRRNIGNNNLEANLLLRNTVGTNTRFDRYFETVWENEDGLKSSLPYAAYAEEGWSLHWKKFLYRFQEWSGASTF